MVKGQKADDFELLAYAGNHYSACADVACGARPADSCPEWAQLVLLCGRNERKAKDVLIEVFLHRLGEATAPMSERSVAPRTGQMSLFM